MYITYIHHSSFLVEFTSCCLLFDYDHRGTLPELPQDKKLYVFASHAHNDHFSPFIFELRNIHPNVTYILSDDIHWKKESDIVFVAPCQSYELDDMTITTYASSDEGVAFLVEAQHTIYHAGDLNWWHWDKENSDEENEEARQLFQTGIQPLLAHQIDVAFLPLDPRQNEQFYYGFDAYMRQMNIRYAFPMHFWKQDKIIDQLCALPVSAPYRDRIMHINRENQRFPIDVS